MNRRNRPRDADATPRCGRCGRKIVWGVDEGGTMIPLDPTPAVYEIKQRRNTKAYIERNRNAMVIHFATCSNRKVAPHGRTE